VSHDPATSVALQPCYSASGVTPCPDQPELSLDVVYVHCFFGCGHTETADPEVGRSVAMEQHYTTRHRLAYSKAVGYLL
jgi:hypothetical protein